MTYQWNIERAPTALAEEDVLDEVLGGDVAEPDVGPDDDARDEHDERALDDVGLRRPLDLLQLAPALGDEPLRARLLLAARAGLRLDGSLGADLGDARCGATLAGGGSRLRLAARSTL